MSSNPTPSVPAPADICTGPYFYKRKCDNAWMAGWPNNAPSTVYQGGGAHTWIAHDSATGKDYSIGDQGTNNPNAYQQPPPEAPFALAEWKRFYVDHNPPGGYETVAAKTPPGGVQTLPAVPLAEVTDPAKKASWTAQFNCSAPPPTLGTFCPDDFITRKQVAAIVWNAMLWTAAHPGVGPSVPAAQQFSDVDLSNPFRKAIDALKAAGIIAGKSPCEKP